MALETLSVRLDASEIERLDAVAVVLAARAHGARITRSNALRVVVEAGLDALEATHRAERTKAKR
jgi:hypothetical protein